MKIKGVMLGSADPKALGEFYTKILGEAGWQQDDWYGFMNENATLMVGPHSDVTGTSKEPARIIINFESLDIKADFETIKGFGAVVVAEPYQPMADSSPDTWLATFSDPDGNYIQLATPWEP